MPRISASAVVIVMAMGMLLFPALMTSQGRRIRALDVSDIDNRPAVAREVLVKLRSPLPGARAAAHVGTRP